MVFSWLQQAADSGPVDAGVNDPGNRDAVTITMTRVTGSLSQADSDIGT